MINPRFLIVCKMKKTLLGEATLPFISASLLDEDQLLKERMCCIGSRFFHSEDDPFSKDSLSQGVNSQSQKVICV